METQKKFKCIAFLSYSVLRESIMIPPPASGLSVDSDAGAPPSAPPGIVSAGGFFLDMISLKKNYNLISISKSVLVS